MIAGSVSKLGGRFILAAELNDLAHENPLLAKFRLNAASEEDILNTMIDSLCGMFQTRIKDAFGIKETTPYLDLSIGDLTTNSLQAYGHFIKGNQLYKSGDFPSGIAEMTHATEIDPNFALSYSMIACAFSFIKTPQADSLSWEYFKKARQFKDQFKGISKETLIFRGNDAWYDAYNDDPDSAKVYREKCGNSYKLITELYPDDRDGYYYYGLYFRYLEKNETAAQEQLRKAVELSPEWFPTYRDLAYSVKETDGEDAAVVLLQDYLKQYPNGVGADYARQTIAELRGAN
jgi:tetratricopeptide (TPR) repeat protein